MTADIKTIYLGSLRNTHAAEQQGLQQMERQLDGLERYPAYIALLKRHIGVTKTQLERIENALSEAGGSVSAIKEVVTGTAGTIGAAVHALAQDETLKNLYAGYAYQFEQIAAYRSLIVIARAAGFSQHSAWIEQSIREEEEAANSAAALIEPVTQQYLDLTLSGQKADS
jgi:ferritin-like metal-binding protein YciE